MTGPGGISRGGVAALLAAVTIMAALIGVAIDATIDALSAPSCEERGGARKFSHFIQVYNPSTRTLTLVPAYRCDLPPPSKGGDA